MEKDDPPELVTPASVKSIISRIETAQMTRAQEDISTQLLDILGNVNCVMSRFQEELGYDLKEKEKSHQTEQKSTKRFILLEKIASFSKEAKTKEKHLYEILHWLGDWGDSLTYEIRKSGEEEADLDEWIEVMEKVLPLSLTANKGGIQSLISLCSTLIEEQKKRAQRSKFTFWQGWQEKNPQNSQPPSPEQMLQDNHATCMKVSELKSMLQELLDSTMFNKGEARAIRYMSTMVENLNKALILQHKENRSLETKYKNLQIEMTKELNSQRLYFQKSIQILKSNRDALLKQVEILGEKCHGLLLIKHALEFQLKKVQTDGDEAEDLVKVLVDSPGPSEKETLPKKEAVMEETQQEPKEQLFSPPSPSPLATAQDSGATPSAPQLLSTMTMHSRIADVFSSKDTDGLEPVSPPSVDHTFPKEYEKLVAESPGHEDKDQEDYFQEKEGPLFHFRKQLSLKDSRKVPSQSEAQPWEKVLHQKWRQQWLEDEKTWVQCQKWALLEKGHQEKLQQWEMLQQREMEDAVRQQQHSVLQPEKEQESPRRELEQPKEGMERTFFTPTSRWWDLAKPEPRQSRAHSAHQSRRPRLPRSPNTQPSTLGSRRPTSSIEFTCKQQAHHVPTKPKKSASFPAMGTTKQRMTGPSLRTSRVTVKEKVSHMDMEAQRKNPQLLSKKAELGLPHYQHGKALEIPATTVKLNRLRLRKLCHKYILCRYFQNLRQGVIKHIEILQETGAPYKAQNLYVFLDNIDDLQNRRLQTWMDKQKGLEKKLPECLSSRVTMFPKLQLEENIPPNIPVVTSPKPRKCKLPPALLQHIPHSGSTIKQPFPSKHQERVPQQMGCQQQKQMEAIWKMDVVSSSHPIEKKTPANIPWDQLGGHPNIPQLLALDTHSSYHKNVMYLNAWNVTHDLLSVSKTLTFLLLLFAPQLPG
ncbi:protein FAM186B [Nycticebus coucang]|uniref:protein FAM186B n=1 Tax=Nycticebus coucang TaxID=9470 RepID=UPI00234DB6B9|nr:protein FAM186B [Nycticebus coucang]